MNLSRGALDLTNGQKYMLDGSEIPFPTLQSIQRLLPSYAQGDNAGAMRDAVLTVIRKLANKIWADTGSNQNGFVSPRYADGPMLDLWGFIEKNPRIIGEDNGTYRTRLLSDTDGITPNAIRNAVVAIAAKFGASVAFQEPASDGEFWTADDPNAEAWCSFWQSDSAIYWNYDPTVINQTTGGFWEPDRAGAQFWVLMQIGAGSDALTPHWTNDATTIPNSDYDDPQDFWADNANDYGYWGFDGDPLEVQIVSEVEARRAFAIAWMLIESPFLNAAY